MTLTQVSMEGFKCFPSLALPLAPLTVLAGFNSAGKSTALQPLLLLAQALRKSTELTVLPLNGDLVRLGTAGEVISRITKRRLRLSLASEEHQITWRFVPSRKLGGHQLLFDHTKHTSAVSKDSGAAVDDSAASRLMNGVRNLIYIGAARRCQIDIFPNPQDAGCVNADVGPEGEYAPWWYVQLADEEVQANRLNTSDSSRTVRGQVDSYLSILFPGARANAEAISRVSATRLEFKMGSATDWLRPANVGFGLSYAFPVIVALVAAAVGQVVVIDSPEAHLHPRAQSAMGIILARFAAAGVQIIVETHSDHILSGIRLGVKQGVLDSNSVALHFFGPLDKKRANVLSPQIDRTGALDQWPVGFFDQAEHDLTMLSGWGDDDAVLSE